MSTHNRFTPGPTPPRQRSRLQEMVARRILGGRLLQGGARPSDVAREIGVSRQTVYAWKAVLEHGGGLTALRHLSRGGRPPRLTKKQSATLKQALVKRKPGDFGLTAKRWTAKSIRQLALQEFNVDLSVAHIRRLCGPLNE